jgi:hypothetical protein
MKWMDERHDAAADHVLCVISEKYLKAPYSSADIDAAFAKGDGRVAITGLRGLRGVRKTVLATAYAERHCGDYRATWWTRALTWARSPASGRGCQVRPDKDNFAHWRVWWHENAHTTYPGSGGDRQNSRRGKPPGGGRRTSPGTGLKF